MKQKNDKTYRQHERDTSRGIILVESVVIASEPNTNHEDQI